MVNVANLRHKSFGDIGACQNYAALIINLNDVAVGNAALFGFLRIYPQRLILVSVLGANLHGLNLAVPDNIVALGVNAPAAVVRHAKEGILLGSLGGKTLIMGLALLYPVGDGRPFGVVGHKGLDVLAGILKKAGGGGELVVFGVSPEVIKTGGFFLCVGVAGNNENLALSEFIPAHGVLAAGGLVEEAHALCLGKTACVGVHILLTQLFADLNANVKVAEAFAYGLNGGLFQIDALENTAGVIIAYVGQLMLGGNGQDEVGEVAIVLKPGMLDDEGFNAGVSVGIYEHIAVVPAGNVAGGGGPKHVNSGLAGTGVNYFLKLIDIGGLAEVVLVRYLAGGEHMHSVPLGVAVHDGLLHEAAGDKLGGSGELLEKVNKLGSSLLLLGGEDEALHVDGVGQVALDGAQSVANMGHGNALHGGEGNGEVFCPHVPFNHLGLMNTGAAKTLHTQQHNLKTGGLAGIGAADIAAAVAVADAGGVLCPVAGKSLDGPGLHAAFLACPFGSLGNAVLLAHNVGHELIEAIGVGGDVFLVVGLLGEPGVGNGQLHGGIGVGEYGNPLVRMDSGAIVKVGADVNLLYAKLGEPETKAGGQVHTEAQRGNLGVAAPEKKTVGILGHVGDEVGGGSHFANGLAAPNVLSTPIPAFPGVHVAHLQGVAAQKGEHTVGAAVAGGDVLAFAVHIAFAENGLGAIGALHAQQLVCANLGSLVPGNADIAALAAVLGIALTLGVPVNALEGILNAVGGVNAGLVAKTEMGGGDALGRRKGRASCFHSPGVAVGFCIFGVIVVGTDAGHFTLVGVHHAKAAAFRAHKAEADNALMFRLKFVTQVRIPPSLPALDVI